LLGEAADIGRIAERLRVDEASLRQSLDAERPHPTLEILAAVVREYAVDPTYLIAGYYDPRTHRQTAEADHRAIADALQAVTLPNGHGIEGPNPTTTGSLVPQQLPAVDAKTPENGAPPDHSPADGLRSSNDRSPGLSPPDMK
jgi:hypothetical protein